MQLGIWDGMEGGVCAVSSHELCPFDLNITLFHGFIFFTIRNKIFNPYQQILYCLFINRC